MRRGPAIRVTAVLLALVSVLARSGVRGQQQPDPDFDARVARPAYTDTDRQPAILFDEAHNNFHTTGGRYKPFASLLNSDGNQVTPNRERLTKGVLQRYEVLVIANALGAPNQNHPDAPKPAFSAAECEAVHDWVEAGGALLLITDHYPFGNGSEELARRFGVDMSKAATFDAANSDGVLPSRLLFTRKNHLLGEHPILQGRNAFERIDRIQTFTGQSLSGPAASVHLLKLSPTAVDRPVKADGTTITSGSDAKKGKDVRAAGRAQGLAFTAGQGRVVVLGEAAMLSAQVTGPAHKPMGMNVPGNDNRQFALNVMHWLSNLPGIGGSGSRPHVAGPTAPAPAAALSRSLSPTATPTPATLGRPLSTAEIVAESEPSVALVKGKDGFGTGFLVERGVLVTNAHVIDDEFISELEIQFPSAAAEQRGPFPARLLYEDAKRDLALLGVKADLPPLRIATAYDFRKGDDITVIGNPGLGGEIILENAISRGVMSTRTKLDGQDFYQLGIAINPGNSGGPVFDSSGQVVGVASRKSAAKEAVAFCIPVDALRAALKQQAGQSETETERVASRHRLVMAVEGLSAAGAWYCLGIDYRRAAGAQEAKSRASLKKSASTIGGSIAELEKERFTILAQEVARVRDDRLVVPTVQSKFTELAENLDKLEAIYHAPRPGDPKSDDLRPLKLTHRRLTISLFETLELELPQGLVSVFDERPLSQRINLTIEGPRSGSARQRPDPDFDAKVVRPAYTGEHPRVLFDEAHHNFLTAGGRYKPLADLLANDGYQVATNAKPLTRDGLAGCAVLIIANAMAAGGDSPDEGQQAFRAEECQAVHDWVLQGGALLLISDHPPWGTASARLAERLGVTMSQGVTEDRAHTGEQGGLVFSRENALLGDHPITQGRDASERLNRVVTFTGQSLKGPEGSVAFLRLADTAIDRIAARQVSAAGRAQGLAYHLGKGRVVVLGEGAQLSAQLVGSPGQRFGMNVPDIDNRQMALNILHWLSGLIGP